MPEETPAVEAELNDQVPADSQEFTPDQATEAPEDAPVDVTSIDPETLPPELQAIYKSMQADYTRKTQALSDAQKKAESFDSLMSNDGIAQMVKNIEEYGTPYPPQQTPPQAEATPAPLSGEEMILKMVEEGPEYLTRLIREEAAKLVEPLRDRAIETDVQATIAQLTEKYPDFMQYETQIVAEIERSGYKLDPEAAYKLATYEKVRQDGANLAAKTVQQRVNAATAGGNSAAVTQKEIKGWADAFEAAKRTHGIG